MWSSLTPWLAQGGVTGILAWVGYRLHVDAINAERRRADDWRAVAEMNGKRADLREQQMSTLLSATREPAS